MSKDELTKQIIGCCFAVHRELGPGFPEKIYHHALKIALENGNVAVESEKRFEVSFEGARVGQFQLDLLVEGRVVVEVKAVSGILPKVCGAQVIAYLKAAKIPVGLLVNFGNSSCQVRRFVV